MCYGIVVLLKRSFEPQEIAKEEDQKSEEDKVSQYCSVLFAICLPSEENLYYFCYETQTFINKISTVCFQRPECIILQSLFLQQFKLSYTFHNFYDLVVLYF